MLAVQMINQNNMVGKLAVVSRANGVISVGAMVRVESVLGDKATVSSVKTGVRYTLSLEDVMSLYNDKNSTKETLGRNGRIINVSSRVNVRKGASVVSEVATTLKANEDVVVLEKVGNWYKVLTNGLTGYVFGTYVELEQAHEGTISIGDYNKGNLTATVKRNDSTKKRELSKSSTISVGDYNDGNSTGNINKKEETKKEEPKKQEPKKEETKKQETKKEVIKIKKQQSSSISVGDYKGKQKQETKKEETRRQEPKKQEPKKSVGYADIEDYYSDVRFNNNSTRDAVKSTPEIDETAREICKNCTTPSEKASALYAWITTNINYAYEQVENKSYPRYTAIDCFNKRRGVCYGYAALYTAMAEAVGLNTQLICGNAYEENGKLLGYHSWNEVQTERGWINLDATFGRASLTALERANIKPNSAQIHDLIFTRKVVKIRKGNRVYNMKGNGYYNSPNFAYTHRNGEVVVQE